MLVPKHNERFTLVEILVVVTALLVLFSMLVPALKNAIETARLIPCAAKLKLIGAQLQFYFDDGGNRLPPPTTSHKKNNVVGKNFLLAKTDNTTCPLGAQKIHPLSFGTFFRMGYIDAIETGKTPETLICPDRPLYLDTGTSIFQFYENLYGTYSKYTRHLRDGTYINMYGSAWDCNQDAQVGYGFRGWTKTSFNHVYKEKNWQLNRWQDKNYAIAADNEGGPPGGGYDNVHAGGLNVLYMDGGVRFAPDFDGLPAWIHYGMVSNNQSYLTARNLGSSIMPVWYIYGFVDLYKYYESL